MMFIPSLSYNVGMCTRESGHKLRKCYYWLFHNVHTRSCCV